MQKKKQKVYIAAISVYSGSGVSGHWYGLQPKDKWDGNELGRISVDYADVWTPFEGKAEFPDGISDLYLTFEGSGSGSLKSIELTH